MSTQNQVRPADLAPGILQASVFVLGTAVYGYLAAQSDKLALWVVWVAIAICALVVAVEAIRYRTAHRPRPRWFRSTATAAFVLAVVFSVIHAAG